MSMRWDVYSELDDSIRTVLAIFRRDMEVLVPGPKTHDLENHLLEDIQRHGSPAGFDCQAGESKIKIQKLKNNYSNKGRNHSKKYQYSFFTTPCLDIFLKLLGRIGYD